MNQIFSRIIRQSYKIIRFSKYLFDNQSQVFDKGLKAISLSVDLWLHYINHCKTIYEKDETKLREQYERAIEACGLEFR